MKRKRENQMHDWLNASWILYRARQVAKPDATAQNLWINHNFSGFFFSLFYLFFLSILIVAMSHISDSIVQILKIKMTEIQFKQICSGSRLINPSDIASLSKRKWWRRRWWWWTRRKTTKKGEEKHEDEKERKCEHKKTLIYPQMMCHKLNQRVIRFMELSYTTLR